MQSQSSLHLKARRHAWLRIVLLMSCTLWTLACSAAPCPTWPLWQAFKTQYVSDDGRVIDASTTARITTSEGQAYALLFALAANDHAAFTRLLQWTENNLARGDLGKNLPAWQWGRTADNEWRVVDDNAASDADVWLAYAFSEAGRLWHEPRYTQLAHTLSEHILRDEVVLVPGLGTALLPGPRGFVSNQTWRFNASYLPVQALRWLAHEHNPLWNEVAGTALRIITASAPHGYAADWIEYRADQGFSGDGSTQNIGSYNAVRVYLWAGMLSPNDPAFTALKQQLTPALQQFSSRTQPAERIDTATLALQGEGAPGFSAAYLPLLKINARNTTLAQQLALTTQSLKDDRAYFSDALILFGRGWLDGWLRFGASGQLQVKWSGACVRH